MCVVVMMIPRVFVAFVLA
jgi:hypothetical protein